MEEKEESRRKTGSAMSSAFRDSVGEGIITLHWKEGQTDSLLKELLPVPEQAHSSQETSVIPKMTMSSPSFKNLPTACFKRKSLDNNWLTQKPFSEVQALIDKESREVNAATKYVLNTETHYVKEFDKYLRHREMLDLRKKEMLYKKWLERVLVPLLQTIDDHIDRQSSEAIENRRRLQLAQYLEYCNKKGYVFLDDYDSLEYNPLFLHVCKKYLKVSTPPLDDPLLRQLQDRFEEEGIALQCETGRIYTAKEIDELHKQKLPLVPLRRQNTNGTEWLRTPLGFIESEVRQRSRQRMRGIFNNGSLDLKIWAESRQTPDLFSNIGHKRKFPQPISRFPSTAKQVVSIQSAKLTAI